MDKLTFASLHLEKWVVSSLSTQKAKCLSNLCKSPRCAYKFHLMYAGCTVLTA
ncbi:hypothetical protein glysoja_027639 [Glycine soja]|uniref:Uncharacterized protein n=1 Tax=Glycine soja TaxID=3848 RepID=A0A0B2QK31_GLYSO|nr:hypothetical protein glysoja_027639 [Glycine soja]